MPGVGGRLLVPVGLINLGLSRINPLLAVYSLLLDGFVADMLLTCSNDPPFPAAWTNDDWAALATGVQSTAFQTAIHKLQDTFLHWFWFQYCQCTTGILQVPTTTIVTPPVGLTVTSPTANNGCFSGSFHLPAGQPACLNNGCGLDATQALMPNVSFSQHLSVVDGVSVTSYPIPQFSQCQLTWKTPGMTNCSGDLSNTTSEVLWWDVNNTRIFSNTLDTGDNIFGGQGTRTFATNPAATWFAVRWGGPHSANCGTTLNDTDIQSTVYCSGGPNQTQAPCATDPQVLYLLQRIYDLENIIAGQLPQQLHSYLESTVHPISGTGSIGVQATALAVKFVGTTLPIGRLDQVGANPSQLLDLGFLTPITTEGPIAAARLTMTPQLLPLPALTQSVGFFLAPSTSGTLTELLRGS